MNSPTEPKTSLFNAWHLESWGYRRSPDNPNIFVHADSAQPGCPYHPVTLIKDLNLGESVLAVLAAQREALTRPTQSL